MNPGRFRVSEQRIRVRVADVSLCALEMAIRFQVSAARSSSGNLRWWRAGVRGCGVPGRRCWAVEGAAATAPGLASFLQAHGERVVEWSAGGWPQRRTGAKTDALDAARAAREALTTTIRSPAPSWG